MNTRLCFACMKPVDTPTAICPHCGHDNHIRDNGPGLLSGGMIADKYIVGMLLGRGGFGATYIGYDLVMQRRVALKEYFPSHLVTRDGNSSRLSVISGSGDSYTRGKQRALRESRMVSGLDALPGVVQTYDVFAANNTIYIVMEYVEGSTLTKYVQKHPEKLTLSHAMALLEQIAVALNQLHKLRIIHRDVKPENIIIRSKSGQGVLLDFGAARANDGTTQSNSSAVVSPGFAPPEQYDAASLDGRIDQYAFAATLYYMLTGQRPVDVMMRIVNKNALKPLRFFNPDVSVRAEEIISKAMSINADDRFPSMAAFWNALRSTAESDKNRLISKPGDKSASSKTGRWGLAAALVAVVLGIGIMFISINNIKCQHQWTPATVDQPKTCLLCAKTEGEPLAPSEGEESLTAHTSSDNSNENINLPISQENPTPAAEPTVLPARDPSLVSVEDVGIQLPTQPPKGIVPIPGRSGLYYYPPLKVEANNYLVRDEDYSGAMTVDGDEETCWQFSTEEVSLGNVYLDIWLPEGSTVDELWLKNGFWKINKKYDQYTRNCRPKKIGISFCYDGENSFRDETEILLRDDSVRKDWQVVSLGRHEHVKAIRLRVISIYQGSYFKTDVAISELMVVYREN